MLWGGCRRYRLGYDDTSEKRIDPIDHMDGHGLRLL